MSSLHKQDGPWSWLVLVCTFLQSWIFIGQMRAHGIFLPILMEEFNQGRDKIALMNSIVLSGGLFLSMFATWLNTIFQSRIVCFTGQMFFVLAFTLSSFVKHMTLLYLTYSIINAVAIALTSASHVLIIFKYFRRHRSLAQGINVSGGALGIMTVPSIAQYLVDHVGWRNAYRISAGTIGLLSLLCIAYSPHVKIVTENEIEVPNDDKQSRRNSDGKDIENNGQACCTKTVRDDIPGAYDNYNCTDATENGKTAKDINLQLETISSDHTKDSYSTAEKNNEDNNPRNGLGGKQCTADTEKHSDSGNHQCTADDKNNIHKIATDEKPSFAHINNGSTANHKTQTTCENDTNKCSDDQEDLSSNLDNAHENPSFVYDDQVCTADHKHLSCDERDNNACTADQKTTQSKCNETNNNEHDGQTTVSDETGKNLAAVQKSTGCSGLLDCSVWRNSKFVFAVIGVSIGVYAMFSPSTHLVKFAEDVGLPATKSATLYTFLGISSLIGRIVAGKICDISWVDPFIVDIVAFLMASIGTFLFTLGKTYLHLAAASAVFGLSDGISRTVMVVILTTSVEPSKVSAAYGQALSAMAPFGLGGPAITGLLADKLGGYNIAYYMNGSILIAAAAVLLIPTILKHCGKSRDYTINQAVTMTSVRKSSNND